MNSEGCKSFVGRESWGGGAGRGAVAVRSRYCQGAGGEGGGEEGVKTD